MRSSASYHGVPSSFGFGRKIRSAQPSTVAARCSATWSRISNCSRLVGVSIPPLAASSSACSPSAPGAGFQRSSIAVLPVTMSPGPVDSRRCGSASCRPLPVDFPRGGRGALQRSRLAKPLHAVVSFRRFSPVDSRRCGSVRSRLPGACALRLACPPLRELARLRTPGCGVACVASSACALRPPGSIVVDVPHLGGPTRTHAQACSDRLCSRRCCHTPRPLSNARCDRRKREKVEMWVNPYQPQRVGPKVGRRRPGLGAPPGPPGGLRRPPDGTDSARSGRNNASNARF